MEQSKLNQVIVALDQMDENAIEHFLSLPENQLTRIKIGLELFLRYGQDFVRTMAKKHEKKIFLDLKLHDIPETVYRAISSLEDLPIEFLTVHLSGGRQMLEAAIKARNQFLPNTKILGISFLTSLDNNEIQSTFQISNVEASFASLFKLAAEAKVDGVVLSAFEAPALKKLYPQLLAITPGIRFIDEINGQQLQDQKRVMSPKEAFSSGADFLVMGRSLTQAPNLKERLATFL